MSSRVTETSVTGKGRPRLGHGIDEALGPQAPDHLRDRRGSMAQVLGQAGLYGRDPLLVELVDRLQILFNRRVVPVTGHT